MYSPPKWRGGKHLIFTQINDNQFLLEGHSNKTKIVGESEYAITSIDLDGGPLIHIGKDFLGRGIVTGIDILDTENNESFIVKITI